MTDAACNKKLMMENYTESYNIIVIYFCLKSYSRLRGPMLP